MPIVVAGAAYSYYALTSAVPVAIGSACLFFANRGAAKIPVEDFLNLKSVDEQRSVLSALLIQRKRNADVESDGRAKREFVSAVCAVCQQEVSPAQMSLTYASCGHRCVCDDCDRDVIVIKLSSMVTQRRILAEIPLESALSQLLDDKQLASSF